jgi:predicted MPP superfamily phosphohydrolase
MSFPLVGLSYIAVASLAAFVLCWADKRRAIRGQWRIAEATLLLAGLCGGGLGLLLGMRVFRHKIRKIKFRILVPLECVLWGVVLLHLVSALTLDRVVQYKEISYSSPQISPALDGYVAAFITDTHAIPAAELREVARRVNELSPNLLLLGGDFPSLGEAPARSMEILAQINTTDGIYGIEGNHDDYVTLFAAMERYGILPLSNSGIQVREGLYLAGVEDLWNREPDIALATADAAPEDFVLLLAHNPDIAMKQDTTGVDLILSGHTHGGQITLFGLFAPALSLSHDISDYGQRFQSGWAKAQDGTDVFVSNGTGNITDIPRIFARPQVILLTLKAE